MKLAKNLERLGTETAFSVLAEAKKLEAQGKEMIHLGLGQPDFKTPQHIPIAIRGADPTGYCDLATHQPQRIPFLHGYRPARPRSPLERPRQRTCPDQATQKAFSRSSKSEAGPSNLLRPSSRT